MEYRYLGKSGLCASRISIGGVQLGSEDVSQSQVDRIIGAMFDAGINLIDTAYIYGRGRSEERIGKALGEKRKDVILVTKGGHYVSKYDPPSVGAPSRRYLMREVEISLKRLNTDYIDVYMWHMGDSIPPHEMLRAMDDLVKSGKVLYIGGSNTPAWKLGVASEYARNHGMNPIVLEQSGYSMLNRSCELNRIPCCLEYGISFMPYRALQSGFLADRYKKGERFSDGRPRVSDDILRRMERVRTEEAWSVLWREGYQFQFEGNWTNLYPDRVLVGRAVTGVFVPHRPDLHDYLMEYGHEKEGRIGAMNSWVIETLVKDDVIVIDLFGKVYKGTFSGANLSTAIATRTQRGQVIYGGIRDAQQILEIDDFCTFCKGMDPTPIRDVTLTGLNLPCRIGDAICMPGDVVLGTYTGVLFIPPHLAEAIVEHAERTYMREIFSHQRLREGTYTSSQMDTKWTDEIVADFETWIEMHNMDDYANIDWTEMKGPSDGDEETTLG